MTNASIITFDDNASAYVTSFRRLRTVGNIPVNILGKTRNDYQSLGLFPGEFEYSLYTDNESNYKNLMKTFHKREEFRYSTNSSDNYYGAATSIHRRPVEAGELVERYKLDVTIVASDPLRYGTNVTAWESLENLTGNTNAYLTIGETNTALDLHYDVYQLNKTEYSGSPTNTTLGFGREDQLGFDHIKRSSFSIPRWSNDDDGYFWSKYNWHSNYILPPVNITYGDCTYEYRESWLTNCSFGYIDYKTVHWSWGMNGLGRMGSQEIGDVWIQDGNHWQFPFRSYAGTRYAPAFYSTGTSAKRCDDNLPGNCNWLACYKYWPKEGDCWEGISGYQLYYGDRSPGELGRRLSYSIGALYLDLKSDFNFDKINLIANIEVPISREGLDHTDGTNLYIWDSNINTFTPFLTYNLKPIDSYTGYKNINISLDETNWSTSYNYDGGVLFLFINQKSSGSDCSLDPPWNLYIDNHRFDNTGKCTTGTSYLRGRVYRKEHRLGTVLKRHCDRLQYIKIDGINDIADHDIKIDIVNATSGELGDYIYRTETIQGENWSGEHIIPLTTLNYLENVSSFGVRIRLDSELLNPTTLPGVKLYNMSDSSVIILYGGEVEVHAGNYGLQKETSGYSNNTYIGKSFVKEYREIETLTKLELNSEIDEYRIHRLQGPWVQGHYEFNAKENDMFTFDPFQNVSDSWYEQGLNISTWDSNIQLTTSANESGSITYLLSPNSAIIKIPTLLIKGNVSTISISSNNETYYETGFSMNRTSYLGDGNIDLRGLQRFFLKLEGGNFSQLLVSCDLGNQYNPLPYVVPDAMVPFEYVKDKDMNVTLNLQYRHAYYS